MNNEKNIVKNIDDKPFAARTSRNCNEFIHQQTVLRYYSDDLLDMNESDQTGSSPIGPSNSTAFESVVSHECNAADLNAHDLSRTKQDDFLAVVSWGQISDASTVLDVSELSHQHDQTRDYSGTVSHSYPDEKYDSGTLSKTSNDDVSTISSIDPDATSMDESHSHYAKDVEAPWGIVLEYAFNELSSLELEEAARSNYCYQVVSNNAQRSVCETTEQQWLRTRRRNKVINDMVLRHWEAANGRIDEAIQTLRAAVRFRIEERVNDLREAMFQSKKGKLPSACVELLNTYFSLSGHDFGGRANIKIHPRSVASRQSSKGSVEASICMIECALTASECKRADMINVTVDFGGRFDWNFPLLVILYETTTQGDCTQSIYCKRPCLYALSYISPASFTEATPSTALIVKSATSITTLVLQQAGLLSPFNIANKFAKRVH